MRRTLGLVLAMLLITGVAYSASIPQMEDPKVGPAVWLVPVYNNDTDTADVGDVVIWEIGESTGDNDNYINRTTTADTFLVAGIVYPSDILTKDTGSIAIRGVVTADLATTHGVVVNSLLCSSTTEGGVDVCSDSATDADAIGFATETPSGTTVKMYLFGR